MSVPALRELRRVFPDASITLHTRTWADGLFRDASFIDELVTFDKSRWPIRDVYDNSNFLRNDDYDLAILFPNSFESALTSFLTRIPRRIGYNKDVRGLLLTDPIAVPEWKNRRHEVYYYMHLIAETERRITGRETVANAAPDSTVEVSDDRKKAAVELLGSAGIDLSKNTVAFAVGSTNSNEKRWPDTSFARLAEQLASDADANILLLGSKGEGELSRSVVSQTATQIFDLTGKTDLDEAVAILSIVDLMVSNDSGLAHVAPAVGTPTIVIFGPTNPETTRPFGGNAAVIRSTDNSSWPTVDEVYAAAEEVFNAKTQRGEDAKEDNVIAFPDRTF